nr:coenzyme F420-0:L-glutamate ligase [Spelaeicoccus albus]
MPGLPEIAAGDDLGMLLARALRDERIELRDGDIVAIASKVVAKAEGRAVEISGRADHEGLVTEQSNRVVAERLSAAGTTQVVRSKAGPVMAAAGIDTSNVEGGKVLLLPGDADRSARELRRELAGRTGAHVGVIVTDTASRPWRVGVSDFALGAAGVNVLDDLRGHADSDGRTLKMTVRALADELAGAADLVKDKTLGLPVALIRGLGTYVVQDAAEHDAGRPGDEGAAPLVRDDEDDWFRYGHVEAIRAALGVRTGEVDSPPIDSGVDDLPSRVKRAIRVASAGTSPLSGTAGWVMRPIASGAAVRVTEAQHAAGLVKAPEGAHPMMVATAGLGALLQRLDAALWAEDLRGDHVIDWRPDGLPDHATVTIRLP